MHWWTDPKHKLCWFNNCQRNWSVLHREKGDGFQFPNEWLRIEGWAPLSNAGSATGVVVAWLLGNSGVGLFACYTTLLTVFQSWTEAKCEVNCTCWCWSWTGWSWSCTGSSWSCTGSSCTVYRLEAKQRCGAHSFGPWGVSTLNTSGQHRSLLFFDIYTYIFQDYQRHQKKRDGSFKITLCKCRKKSRKSFSVCD